MPFKSEAQRRLFHVLADKGEMSQKTVHEWEHATPKRVKKNLPYHVKKKEASVRPSFDGFFDELEKIGSAAGLLKGIAAGGAIGGGLSAMRGVQREMDLREQESGKFTPEQIEKARKARNKYHLARTVAGAAAGGIVGGAAGHYGPKALSSVREDMRAGVEKGFNDAGDAVANRFKREWGPELQKTVDRNVAEAPGKAARGAVQSFKGTLKQVGSKILSKFKK